MKRFIVWGSLLCVANTQAAQHQPMRTPCNNYPNGACLHCQAHRANQLINTKKAQMCLSVLALAADLERHAIEHEKSDDGPETTASHCMLCDLNSHGIPQKAMKGLAKLLDELVEDADDSSCSSSSSSSSSSSPSGSTVVYYSSSSSSASTLPSASESKETVAGALVSNDDIRNGSLHGSLMDNELLGNIAK